VKSEWKWQSAAESESKRQNAAEAEGGRRQNKAIGGEAKTGRKQKVAKAALGR
jgi:hypothetical protein